MNTYTFKHIGSDNPDVSDIEVAFFVDGYELGIYPEGNGDWGVIVCCTKDLTPEDEIEVLNETHRSFNEAIGATTRFLQNLYKGI